MCSSLSLIPDSGVLLAHMLVIKLCIITVVFIIMFIFREKLMKLFKSVQK